MNNAPDSFKSGIQTRQTDLPCSGNETDDSFAQSRMVYKSEGVAADRDNGRPKLTAIQGGEGKEPGKKEAVTHEEALKEMEGTFPTHIYNLATRAIVSGTEDEKELTRKLVGGTVTSDRFYTLMKLLKEQESFRGSKEAKKTKARIAKALAGRAVKGDLSMENMEFALEELDEVMADKEIADIAKFSEKKSWTEKEVKAFVKKLKENKLRRAKTEARLEGSAGDRGKDAVETGREEMKSLIDIVTTRYEDYRRSPAAGLDSKNDSRRLSEKIGRLSILMKQQLETAEPLRGIFRQLGGDARGSEIFEGKVMSLLDGKALGKEPTNVSAAEVRARLQEAQQEAGLTGDVQRYVSQITDVLNRVQQLEHEHFTLFREVTSYMDTREAERRLRMEKTIKNWSRSCGVDIRPGTKIRYVKPIRDEATGKMKYEEREEVIDDVLIDPSKGEEVEFAGQKFGRDILPLVVVTNEGRFYINQFQKWVQRVNCSEIVENKDELEISLEENLYGESLERGMSIAWSKPYITEDAQIAYKEDRVSIKSIDNRNRRIYFSKPVMYIAKDAAPHAGLEKDFMVESMTFGEFKSWMVRFGGMRKLSSRDELNEKLARLHHLRFSDNEYKYGEVQIELNEDIIESGPDYGIGTGKKGTIIGIDDINGITVRGIGSDGKVEDRKYTWTQFYRYAYDKELIAADPQIDAQRSRRIMEKAGRVAVPTSAAAMISTQTNEEEDVGQDVEQGEGAEQGAANPAAQSGREVQAEGHQQILNQNSQQGNQQGVGQNQANQPGHQPPQNTPNGNRGNGNRGSSSGTGGNGAPPGPQDPGGPQDPNGPDDGNEGVPQGTNGAPPGSPGGPQGPQGPDDPNAPDEDELVIDEATQKEINKKNKWRKMMGLPPLSEEEIQEMVQKKNEKQARRKEKLEKAKEKFEKKQEESEKLKGTYQPQENALREFWLETQILSVSDVWELFKATYEYLKRWWDRHAKRRYATYGENVPFIGPEMRRIRESTEQEEVNKFKEALKDMGIPEIREIMHKTRNLDQIKACIETLCEKGQMRWDDIPLWRNLNRKLPASKRVLYDTSAAEDAFKLVKKDPITGRWMTGIEMFEEALDELWGAGYFTDHRNSNISKYNSEMEASSNKGDELEADPSNNGGVTAYLGALLERHMHGEWVDPFEYEGMIRFIIRKGKSNVEAKAFYIIQGVATGLLSLERIGAIDGEYLNQLPWLDYFTDPGTIKKAGQDKAEPYTLAQIQRLGHYLLEDPSKKPDKKYAPGARTKRLIWEEVLRSPRTVTRTKKGIRSGDMMDHDDTQFIFVNSSESGIENACGYSGGRKPMFTVPGYLNGYSGFSQWMLTNAKLGDTRKLIEGIRTYVRFDSILDSRYKADESEKFNRLSDSDYSNPAVVDPIPVRKHQKQMNDMIKKILDAYGIGHLKKVFDKITRHSTEAQKKEQQEIDDAVKSFGIEFNKAVSVDRGERVMEIVKKTGLFGTNTMEKDYTKEQRSAAAQIDAEIGEEIEFNNSYATYGSAEFDPGSMENKDEEMAA